LTDVNAFNSCKRLATVELLASLRSIESAALALIRLKNLAVPAHCVIGGLVPPSDEGHAAADVRAVGRDEGIDGA
jgi:hypothetical protein